MGLFENFPYTNFHRLNLDWVLQEMKKVVAEWAETKTEWADTKIEWQNLYNYVHDYFDNLDLSAEVQAIIDQMMNDGTLRSIMEPYINQLAGDVSDLRSDMDVLEARMDSFVHLAAGSTTGDAELIDARIGGNGVTYTSAGDAIRAQYTINHRAIYRDDDSQAPNIIQQVDWELGGIRYTDGTELNVNTRIRTKGYLPTSAEVLDLDTSGYGCNVFCYDAGGGYLGEWSGTNAIVPSFTGFTYPVCIGDIYRMYPGTRCRVTIYPRGGSPDPTVATAAGFILTSSVARWGQPQTIRVCQYNIGKFAWGGSGGMDPALAPGKIKNYHDFLGEYRPDFVCMQEYTDDIDSAQTYQSADIFDPLYESKSNEWRECIIYTNNLFYKSDETYLHTSGDLPAWCVWGDCHINGKYVRVVSGVFSTGSSLAEKQRAIDKLMTQIVNTVDNVILCFDTNVADQTEADAVKSYFATYGVTCSNWNYFGYKDTYNLSSPLYHAIDNIMIKGDMKIRSFIVPDVYGPLASDHFPVIADIAVL